MGVASLDLLTIQQPNLSDRVVRGLDLKGDVPGLLQPRFDLSIQADDFTYPEYKYLSRTMLMGAVIAQAAGAALFSTVGLTFNAAATTADSFRLARIKSVTLFNPNAAAIVVGMGIVTGDLTVFASGQIPTPLDSRWLKSGVQARGSCRTVAANIGSAFVGAQWIVGIAAGASLVIPLDVIISSVTTGFAGQTGGAFLMAPSVVNQSLTAAFQWEEREMLSSEA